LVGVCKPLENINKSHSHCNWGPWSFTQDCRLDGTTWSSWKQILTDSADSLTKISSHLEESSIYLSLLEIDRW